MILFKKMKLDNLYPGQRGIRKVWERERQNGAFFVLCSARSFKTHVKEQGVARHMLLVTFVRQQREVKWNPGASHSCDRIPAKHNFQFCAVQFTPI